MDDPETEKMSSPKSMEENGRQVPLLAGPQSDAGVSSSEPVRTRETWSRKIDFLLACIGFSVGLGNVWRFPYLCYKNGGGAFLLPYLVCVVLGGLPTFFLEVALGQYMSAGGIQAWNICPLFIGIGIASTIIVFLLNVYYNVILAWAFYYLFSSFTTHLPWATCGHWWNTAACHLSGYNGTVNTTSDDVTVFYDDVTLNGSLSNETKWVDPSTEFWERRVLQLSSGIEEVGEARWDLTLCLLLAWVAVYFCIWKGIKSSGKVMYFTATSPYLLMLVLLVRGLTLPGAMDGIKFYLIPEWHRLKNAQVWVDAGTQIFFSYSISLGTLTALGSYNKFHHNCWRDCVLFACINSSTSILAGFVIFSVLGFMAHEQNTTVDLVAESGPGLAFIAYPKALSQMPIAPLWAVLFFCMIILLGLDSQFVGVEGFITAVTDLFPRYTRGGYRRELFIGGVCVVSFLIGISMVTQGGIYVFQIFDYYSGSRIILLVAFMECMVISWIYGARRFHDNLTMMLGFRIFPYVKIAWSFVTPIFTLVMFGLCIYSYSELTYNRTYKYPRWAIVFGWLLACSSVFMIPVTVLAKFLTAHGTLKQRFAELTRPRLKSHQLRPCDDPRDLIDNDVTDQDSEKKFNLNELEDFSDQNRRKSKQMRDM